MIDIESLRKIVGNEFVFTERERLRDYLYDETVSTVRPEPATNVVLLKPGDAQQISDILRLANQNKTPVFVRGGGTGLCGAAIPTKNGLLILPILADIRLF